MVFAKSALGALSALVFATVLTLVPAGRALAATNPNPTGSLSLVTSPLPIDLVAKPGTSISTDLKIQNIGNANEVLKVTLMKFGAEGEEGTPALLHPEPGDESVNWVKFSQTTVTAEPNVWKTVKMTINLPKSAAFGYYYAVVFSRANEGTVPKQANLKGAVATLVLLEAQVPNAKRSAQVLDFYTPHNLYEFLPASFTVRLKNNGNVHVAPRGNIFIKQGKKTVDLLEVNLHKGSILPGTKRAFTADWDDGYPKYITKEQDGKTVLDKNNKPIRRLQLSDFNPGKIRIGKYTAHMVLAYNDGLHDIPIEGDLSFWVIPWRAIILGILLLVGLEYLKIVQRTIGLLKSLIGIKKR